MASPPGELEGSRSLELSSNFTTTPGLRKSLKAVGAMVRSLDRNEAQALTDLRQALVEACADELAVSGSPFSSEVDLLRERCRQEDKNNSGTLALRSAKAALLGLGVKSHFWGNSKTGNFRLALLKRLESGDQGLIKIDDLLALLAIGVK